MFDMLILAVAWLAYFSIHSLLAATAVKRWIVQHRPDSAPVYRLLYNILALALLVPPLWLAHRSRGEPVWVWTGAWGHVADGLLLLALAGFAWSLRYYDMRIFLGISQWRRGAADPAGPGPLCLSPLHRCVRHPWYALGLLIVWSRDLDWAWLVSALLITVYFVVGSRLEEHKLLRQYGEVYRQYQRSVPAFFPWFGRTLSRDEARGLTARAGKDTPRD